MLKINPSEKLYLENGEKFFSLELMEDHLVSRTGKIGTKGRETIQTPKTTVEKNNIRHFANKLIWKKYKAGYYHIAGDEAPLRLQIPTPEHLKAATFTIIDNHAYIVQDSDNRGSRIWKLDPATGQSEKIYESGALMIRSVKHLPGTTELLILSDYSVYGIDIKLELLDMQKGSAELLAESRYFMSPDIMDRDSKGEKILFGVDDKRFCIMERGSRKILLEAPLLETASSGTGTAAQISGNGKYCALAGQTKEGTLLRIHDLENNGEYECKIADDTIIDDMAWVTDTSLVLLERFGQPAIWSIDKNIEKAPVTFTGSGSRVAVSPDKRLLASYETGVNVTISEIESGKAIAEIHEPLHLKYGTLGFISDDKIMITGGGVISVFQFS